MRDPVLHLISVVRDLVTDSPSTVLYKLFTCFPVILACFLYLYAYLFSAANAQAVDPDKINFTVVSIYKDLC